MRESANVYKKYKISVIKIHKTAVQYKQKTVSEENVSLPKNMKKGDLHYES